MCDHKRIKKNFPFGRKSAPVSTCKDCGILITRKFLEKRREETAKFKKQNRRSRRF